MTCKMCRQTQDTGIREHCPGIDEVKQCPHDDVKYLHPGNRRFANLFSKALPMLFDGMGGINPASIQLVFDTWQIPEGIRPVYLDKTAMVIAAIREIQKEERDKRR